MFHWKSIAVLLFWKTSFYQSFEPGPVQPWKLNLAAAQWISDIIKTSSLLCCGDEFIEIGPERERSESLLSEHQHRAQRNKEKLSSATAAAAAILGLHEHQQLSGSVIVLVARARSVV